MDSMYSVHFIFKILHPYEFIYFHKTSVKQMRTIILFSRWEYETEIKGLSSHKERIKTRI